MISKIGYYDVNEEWISQQKNPLHDQSAFSPPDENDWAKQANIWIDLAHSCMQTELLPKYQYHVIDRCLRGASDIISCETTAVHSNTASLIQWCKQWSKGAVTRYAVIFDQMKYAREGKPPTHRQVCEARHKDTNKRFFTAEHKFPIMIPKKGIRDRGWTLEEARDWMWQHSRVTIVTQEENKRLLPFTEDMKIASKRYEEANIEVCIHPRYLAEGEDDAN